jgi:oxygen-independent coproporphyrinogen III oxidase
MNAGLLVKYGGPGPRYTSYPTAPQFHAGYTAGDHLAAVAAGGAEVPLSLYVHLPFCKSVCYYCGCNVTYTKDKGRCGGYLDLLEREMAALAGRLRPGRRTVQIHWGGGTPTFFPPAELARLAQIIRGHFNVVDGAEWGVELDPRATTAEHLDVMAAAGVNRLSLGVQDNDPAVQQAVHRVQPMEVTAAVAEKVRARGFGSLSIDLIYGLPRQTSESFGKTVYEVLQLRPERLAVFNFAYLPQNIPHQKAIRAEELPSPEQKAAIFLKATEILLGAGYRLIGMDHFALPDDPLSRALDAGTLYRNFQGYTTHAGCDLLGLGVSSISQTGDGYAQNEKELADYQRRVAETGTATVRGWKLTAEDRLRRDVIQEIMCRFRVDYGEFGRRHGVDFREHFAGELGGLDGLESDGLVERSGEGFRVTETGRMLVRNVAMVFDTYLKKGAAMYSKTV